MASTNILNPVDVPPNAQYPSDPRETSRRIGCHNFLKQLLDESRKKWRSPRRCPVGSFIYDWYFSNLPISIFDRFGSAIDREGRVPNLNDWTAIELQVLHHELDNGTVRVDLRSQEENTATGTQPRTSGYREFLPQSNIELMKRMKLEINRKTGRPVPENTAHVDVINPEPRPGFLVLHFRWTFSPEYPCFPQNYFVNWSEAECHACQHALDTRRLSVCRITEPSQSPMVDLVKLPNFRVRLEPEFKNTPSRSSTSSYRSSDDNDQEGVVADDAVNLDRIEAFEFKFLPSPIEPKDQGAISSESHEQSNSNSLELRVQDQQFTDTEEFSKLFAAIRTESEKRREEALKVQAEQLNRTFNARKHLELAALKEKVANAEREASKWNMERPAMKTELQEARWKATRLMGDNSVMRSNLASAQNRIETLNKSLQNCGLVHGQLTNDNFILEAKLEDMKKDAAQHPGRISELELRLAETQTRLDSALAFRADAERCIADTEARFAELESRLELANTRIQEQSNDLRGLLHETNIVEDRLHSQINHSTILEKQQEMSEKYIEELRHEMRRKIAAARKKGEAEGRDKAIEDMGRQHIRRLGEVQGERSEKRKFNPLQESGTQTSAISLQDCGTQTSAVHVQECGTQSSANSLRDYGSQTSGGSSRNCGSQTPASILQDCGTQTSANTLQNCGIQTSETSDTTEAPVSLLDFLTVQVNVNPLNVCQLLREEAVHRYVELNQHPRIIEPGGLQPSTETETSPEDLTTALTEAQDTTQLSGDLVEKVEEFKLENLFLSPPMPLPTPAPPSPVSSSSASSPTWPLIQPSLLDLSPEYQESTPQVPDPTPLGPSKQVQSLPRKSKRRRPLPSKPLRTSSQFSDPETSFDEESTIIVDTSALSAPTPKKRRRLLRDG